METSKEVIARASFDIDGVIWMGPYPGVNPGPNDIIITGRSYEEGQETEDLLIRRGLGRNQLYMNPLTFDEKSRETSGVFKGQIIKKLNSQGYNIVIHYEDDPIQKAEIERIVPDVQVVLLVHNLVEKENVRHELY